MRKLYVWPYYQVYACVEKSLQIHLTCIACHCEHTCLRDSCFGGKTRFFTNGHFSLQLYNLYSRSQRLYNRSTDGQIWFARNFDVVFSDFKWNHQSQFTFLIHNMTFLDIPKNEQLHIFHNWKNHFCQMFFSIQYRKQNSNILLTRLVSWPSVVANR